LKVIELVTAKMRRALCGLMRIVTVAEVGVFCEWGKDQPQQPEATLRVGGQAGTRSRETRVDAGYSTIFEN
jgi:hypothetical protein